MIPARLTPYVYVAPAVILMIAALAYPIGKATELAFYDWGMGTPWETARWIGSEAFVEMLASPQVWTSMGVTFAFVAIAVTAEMVLGTALALFLERPVRGMRFFRTVFVLPMMIAPICVGLIWRYMFDAQFGPINHLLGALGMPTPAWLADPTLAFIAMVVTDIWQWTPFVFIMVLAALQGLDSSVVEASRIDGASRMQQIFAASK
jgi:multiple sugar transport system permease protein